MGYVLSRKDLILQLVISPPRADPITPGVEAPLNGVPGLGAGECAQNLGWALLLLVYLGVVTPTGIVMRMFGKDLLGRRIDRARRSYWAPHGGSRPREDYFRQS